MRPTILLKLSYGILKESLLHPSAILVLDKATGKVSRAEDSSHTAPESQQKLRFVPLSEKVVVKPIEREETTSPGIILPESVKERPLEGEVVAVGPGVPIEIKVGDRVIYTQFACTEYKDGDEEYLILRESDILAKSSPFRE